MIEGRPALPPGLERCALGREREALLVSRREPDLAGRLGLRRAEDARGLHVLAQVVARRRREHGQAEPGIVRRAADPDLEPAGERAATGSPASRRSSSTPGATTCAPCAPSGTRTAGSTGTSRTCTRSTSPARGACGSSRSRRRRPTAAGRDRRCSSPATRPPANRFLWDGKNGDDADIWAVLSRRYYGQYGDPRGKLAAIARARRAGKMIWSSTYTGVGGSPGYSAAEPLSDPRMFLLWNALEGIQGTLYAQGLTSYTPGESARRRRRRRRVGARLPGRRRAGGERAPGADPRRDRGLGRARRRPPEAGPGRGANDPRERRPLQRHRAGGSSSPARSAASSTDPTRFSWPQWSHDASTAQKIEAAHLQALRAASG